MLNAVTVYSRMSVLREMLEAYIQDTLSKEIPYEEVFYALKGGKALRGTLALFMAECLGGDPSIALPIAFALELMHSASLIHDDIIDKSEVRRGRESFWKKYGLEKSIIYPHVLMATAIKYVSKAGIEAVRESMDAWRKAAIGQIWDMEILKGERGVASYIDIVAYKTGAVFEASSVLPLYALGLDGGIISTAKKFGLSLGSAYQILDDLSDIEKGEKSSGSVLKLLEESGGEVYPYALNLFKEELDKILKNAAELSIKLAYYARYSLETFLQETSDETHQKILGIINSRWTYWGLPDYR
ncbi:hypothetical protein MA03_00890 [Infirmifilum uzonense]|uniref:Polyprenyl synthetase n=1 Tax=Infirmifilum uzonense TaxID=1550241 RepID=A0A0F7FG24_9CREN|nr:polyprenyl synthetase family protein [Infirmifilum uzonense]AKG38137.1 hypothetical protein MA03_00890 [Infirmifilum uzonense]